MATVRVPMHLRSSISEGRLLSHPTSYAPREDPLDRYRRYEWCAAADNLSLKEIGYVPVRFRMIPQKPTPASSTRTPHSRAGSLRPSPFASPAVQPLELPTVAAARPRTTPYRPWQGLNHLDIFHGSHGKAPDVCSNLRHRPLVQRSLSLEELRLVQPSREPDGLPHWWHRSEPS